MEPGKAKAGEKSSEGEKLTPQQVAQHQQGQKPEWANGLRQLYDAVVEEPLPDSFTDLLAQLDKKS